MTRKQAQKIVDDILAGNRLKYTVLRRTKNGMIALAEYKGNK